MNAKSFIILSIIAANCLFAQQTTKLKEIKVTANKLEENIHEVPQSISVFDEERLDELGIKKIDEIFKEVPNFHTTGEVNEARQNYRGIKTSLFSNANPVVIYIDGVAYYDRTDYRPSLANIERIEVLRGPQGTLYGKDAIGGVINIITKEPNNKWSGSIKAEYGNDNFINTMLNANGALIDDKLYLGINGAYSKNDGWVDSDENSNKYDSKNFNAFLSFTPTDRLSGKFSFSQNYFKKHCQDGYYDKTTASISEIKREKTKYGNYTFPSILTSKLESQSLSLSYEFDSFNLNSTTTHKKNRYNGKYGFNLDLSPNFKGLSLFNNNTFEFYNQEFKVSGKNEYLKWVGGIYLDDEKRSQGPYGQEFPSYDKKGKFLGNFLMNANSVSNSKTQAIFSQAIIPFLNKFELTLGGRFQKLKKDINLQTYMSPVGTDTAPIFNFNGKKTWDKFLPKIALSYKTNENLMFYTSFSQGYMPGGFNTFSTSGGLEENSFEPELSTNYEVGMKFKNNDLSLNLALFRMDIKDIHIYKYISESVVLVDNAKKAHSQGVELDMSYYFTNNIELTSTLGITDAKYDDYDTGVMKFDGKRIEFSPKYTATLGLNYIADSGFYGGLNFSAIGKTSYFNSITNKMLEFDGAIISNARVGYRFENLDIYAFIHNITDEEYVTSYITNPMFASIGFNEPRQFGVGFKYKF